MANGANTFIDSFSLRSDDDVLQAVACCPSGKDHLSLTFTAIVQCEGGDTSATCHLRQRVTPFDEIPPSSQSGSCPSISFTFSLTPAQAGNYDLIAKGNTTPDQTLSNLTVDAQPGGDDPCVHARLQQPDGQSDAGNGFRLQGITFWRPRQKG